MLRRHSAICRPKSGLKIRHGALENRSKGGKEAIGQHLCESRCKCLIHDGRKDDREPILQMSLNIFLEVLHPIEAALEFNLHIADAFGGIADPFDVHLMHFRGTQFKSCPSLLVLTVSLRTEITVLLVINRHSPENRGHGVAHNGTNILA